MCILFVMHQLECCEFLKRLCAEFELLVQNTLQYICTEPEQTKTTLINFTSNIIYEASCIKIDVYVQYMMCNQ